MNFNTKLDQISETFANELATGRVVVIGAKSGNPINDHPTIKLRLCQSINDNAAENELLGLKPRMRTILQSVRVDKAIGLGIMDADGTVNDGVLLPEEFNIQHVDEIYPAYTGQEPKKYGLGVRAGETILHKGQQIYAHVSLVMGKAHDFILKGDRVATAESIANAEIASEVQSW